MVYYIKWAQKSLVPKVPGPKSPRSQKSPGPKVLSPKSPQAEKSLGPNVLGPKRDAGSCIA